MNESICLNCDAPESGIVLTETPLMYDFPDWIEEDGGRLELREFISGFILDVVTPSEDFFDAALDVLITVEGEIQIEKLNAAFSMELPLDLDTLSLWLPVPLELCTAAMRQPWMYSGLTLQVTQEL